MTENVMLLMRFLRQYGTFLAVSGSAALVNLLARILFSKAVIYEIAIVLAYLIAMTYAFALNRRFVFTTHTGRARTQYTRFVIVNLLALAQVWMVSVGLFYYVFPAIGFAWHAETVAHAIGLSVPAVSSFIGHKYYSFRA